MTVLSEVKKAVGEFNLEADSIEEATGELFWRLIFQYRQIQPMKSEEEFLEEILRPLFDNPSDDPIQLIVGGKTIYSAQANRGFMILLVTSCKHFVEAQRADEAGLQIRAWNRIASATYYLGKLEGLSAVEPAIAHIITSRGAKGGKKRDSKYVPLRDLAIKLVSQKIYANKNQAAIAIKGEIMAESKRLGAGLMEPNAVKTISGWISECEFGGK
jgi:hypothetical protein